MKVNLGNGFGPLDFDENGKMFSIFPENIPYVDEEELPDDSDLCVYVDAELVEAVCNAGLDFEEFLRADADERKEMMEEAGVDPTPYDLDFDKEIREQLEEEGLLDDYYRDDDDFEDEDYDEDEDDDYDDEEDYEDDDDYEDEDDDDDYDGDDDGEDEFFGDL